MFCGKPEGLGDRPINYKATACARACSMRNNDFSDKSDDNFSAEEFTTKGVTEKSLSFCVAVATKNKHCLID